MKLQAGRVNYIDWLRVGAMFLLLFFHTGRLFDSDAWHIKNAVLNQAFDIFNGFLNIWHMPLFFILAGASVWFALQSRTASNFTRERVLRLFVPLVFSILIIVPPQVYTERVFDGDFTGSFLAWYPNTFQGTYTIENAASGNLSWHHLWFLAYLFVFSLILVPLFRYFRNEKRQSLISKIAEFVEKPGAVFLPALPLVIFNVTLVPIFGFGTHNLVMDWAAFLFYITIFFYGFLLVADGRIVQSMQRNIIPATVLAVVFSLGIYVLNAELTGVSGAIRSILLEFLYAAGCWCWLVVILGLGSRLLNYNNKVLRYASDAVLPVYILHQTMIVVIGFYVIQWDTGIAAKYFFVAAAALLSSLIIYEVVKRTNPTRFLFGMKTMRKTPAVRPSVVKET